MKIFQNKHFPFWLIAFTAMIGLTLPVLIQDGMFMDAMLYTSVAHNLSMGIGNFWFPQFSYHNVAGLASFHEQPPLVFGIQAVFFLLLGDSLYVERFYTFLMMCLTAFLIYLLWKKIFVHDTSGRKTAWLPVLFWISIPSAFWSYSNNMLENTMGVFTLCSVYFSYAAIQKKDFPLTALILSGIFIFLASFSKGIPGFFPVTVPVLHWLTTRKIKFSKALVQTLVISGIPAFIYALLFLLPESKESMSDYLFKRALHRIHDDPTVSSRFYTLQHLAMELLPQLIIVGILFLVATRRKMKTATADQAREAVFFLCIGLAASAPLMLTMVQKSFYYVPALPFMAIGLSMLIVPVVSALADRIDLQKLNFKIFCVLTFLLFIGMTTFALLQKGKISRNKELLHDVYLIGKVVPKHSLVTVSSEMLNEWDMQCYLIRYFNISVEAGTDNRYFILDQAIQKETPAGYQKVELDTKQFHLFSKKLSRIQQLKTRFYPTNI